jgi:hypothetical protein
MHGRAGCFWAGSENDIDAEFYQFIGQRSEPFQMIIRTTVLEPVIAALDVAHVMQSSSQGLNGGIARANANRKPAYHSRMSRWFSEGKQKYEEKTPRADDRRNYFVHLERRFLNQRGTHLS